MYVLYVTLRYIMHKPGVINQVYGSQVSTVAKRKGRSHCILATMAHRCCFFSFFLFLNIAYTFAVFSGCILIRNIIIYSHYTIATTNLMVA